MRKALYKGKQTRYIDEPPRFEMGPNYWTGFYPDFHVHLDFAPEEGQSDIQADIHFHCRTPGWRPGEGPAHYGSPDGDWYDIVAMIPWAEVDGTMTINGETRAIKGFGYSDHNTQTIFPTKQVERLSALRSFSKDYSVNFLDYVAPETFGRVRTTWLLIMKGNRILYATDKWDRELFDFEKEPGHGHKYPTRVMVGVDQPGCKLTGEIKGTRFLEALDAIEELPAFLRPFASKFMSVPVFIRQNAVVDWKLVMPGEGIDARFTAKGVYENTIVK